MHGGRALKQLSDDKILVCFLVSLKIDLYVKLYIVSTCLSSLRCHSINETRFTQTVEHINTSLLYVVLLNGISDN